MVKIGIIIGSIRQERIGRQVGDFIYQRALDLNIEDAEFEIIDLIDYDMPFYTLPVVPRKLKEYPSQVVKDFSAKIKECDGYIFITPEYNKAIPASLKNALEQLKAEWFHKAAGIVGYGSTLGVTATQNLRLIFSNLKIADVGPFGAFNLYTDFIDEKIFKPSEVHDPTIKAVITDTVKWAKALKTIRKK